MTEIIKGWWHNGKSAQFYHLRDKDQREIDLVLVRDGVAHPVEIKKAAAPSLRDVRHFKALETSGLRRGAGVLVCLCPLPLPLSADDWAMPVGLL